MDYAKAINTVLKEKGITQMELSESSGIAQATLSRILNNKVRASLVSVERISKALELPKVVLDFYALEESDIPDKKKRVYKLLYPQLSEIMLTIITNEDTRTK